MSDSTNADASRARAQERPVLKLALELGPLVVFFLANRYGEELAKTVPALDALGGRIFVATAIFMAAMSASLVLSRMLVGRLPVVPLVTFGFVLVFGGLTLWLKDETFIKMKPTIVNCLFGAILTGGLLFGKSLLAHVFDSAFHLDAEGWRKLTLRWAVFFFVLAGMNELVWRNFATDAWVNFKVWGTMPLTMLFMMAQLPLLKRHMLAGEKD
jgi:intracellular septation protein